MSQPYPTMIQPFPTQKAAEAVNQIYRTLLVVSESLPEDDPLGKEVERSSFCLGLLSAGIWGLLGLAEGQEAVDRFLAAIEAGEDLWLFETE